MTLLDPEASLGTPGSVRGTAVVPVRRAVAAAPPVAPPIDDAAGVAGAGVEEEAGFGAGPGGGAGLVLPAMLGAAPDGDALVGRIARSGLWTIAASTSSGLAALATSIIVARALGPASLGRYSYLVWIATAAPLLLGVGIPVALTRRVSEKADTPERWQVRGLFRLAWGSHLLLLPALALATLAVLALGRAETGLTLATAAAIGATLVLSDLEALAAGLCRFRMLGVFTIVGALSLVAETAAAAALGLSWRGFVTLNALNMTVALLALGTITARQVRRLPRPRPLPVAERSRFWRFARILAVSAILEAVVWGRPEVFFLQHYRSSADLGLYITALRISSVTLTLPVVAARALMPEFSRLRALGDERALEEVFPRVCALLACLTAPLAFGGAAVAGPVLVLVYGHAFHAAGAATAVLMAGGLINALAGPATAAVLVGPRPRLVTEVGAGAVVVMLALDFLLIPRFGPVGAAAANVVVQSACVLVGLAYAWRRMGLRPPVGQLLRVLGVAGLCALVAAATLHAAAGAGGRLLPVLVAVAAGAAAYVVGLAGTGTLTWSDLHRLRSRPPGVAP